MHSPRVWLLICLCVAAIVVSACSYGTRFYTQYFHPLNTNELNLKGTNPKETIDANVGSFQGWDLYLRSVSTYGSRHKENLKYQSYWFTVQTVSPRKSLPLASLLIDTISVSLWPDASTTALPCQSVRVDSVSWKNEFRRILAFGKMELPTGKDTIMVAFVVRDSLSGQTYPVKLPMVRFQGTYKEHSAYRD